MTDNRDRNQSVTLDEKDRVTFTPVDWQTNFRRTYNAPWAEVKLLAVSAAPEPHLLLWVDQSDRPMYLWRERELRKVGKTEKDDLRDVVFPSLPEELRIPKRNFDLWIADVDGRNAYFVRNFQDCRIDQLAWSSDGNALLYRMAPDHPQDSLFPVAIQALNLKDQKVATLPGKYQDVPIWGADSRTIFLWRKLTDAAIVGVNVTAWPRWQLFRVDDVWDKVTLHSATSTVFIAPTPLSPDGRQLLYGITSRNKDSLNSGPSVVETLSTGRMEPLDRDMRPLPARQPEDCPYESLWYYHWSNNARWLFFNLSDSMVGSTSSSVTDLTTHQETDLNLPLLNWAKRVIGKAAEEDALAVKSFTWLSQDDNRLLLEMEQFEAIGCIPPPTRRPSKYGWVVYDPTLRKLLMVEGLPITQRPLNGPLLYRVGTHYLLYPLHRPE